MLHNARVTAFIVSELLRENQRGRRGGGGKITHPTQNRVKFKVRVSQLIHNNYKKLSKD